MKQFAQESGTSMSTTPATEADADVPSGTSAITASVIGAIGSSALNMEPATATFSSVQESGTFLPTVLASAVDADVPSGTPTVRAAGVGVIGPPGLNMDPAAAALPPPLLTQESCGTQNSAVGIYAAESV